jgi:hypothetical protein
VAGTGVTEPNPILRCSGIVHVFDLPRSLRCQCDEQEWHGEIPGSRPAPLRLVEPADDEA